MEEIYKGKFLHYIKTGNWEWVTRPNDISAAVIAAVTDKKELVLIEQFRVPMNAPVIEWPAGLVGDGDYEGEESFIAAQRELEEETGYYAKNFKKVVHGPVSAGMSDEANDLYIAWDLEKVSEGGGVDDEEIITHLVPFAELHEFIEKKQAQGCALDLKVFVGVYFLQKEGLI
ncbi:NUDIX hydrolase [Lentisphaera araneosa HTCC2155]|uniref:NUDIX hydrolase n=1 Tax=Lentisphaera araneosa HTCC2155 TaxID=313628 RepID=A6DL97_9BACT|nr:NUDIX hydrolase [Lentisphaera araneosa]EDM27699.1 NUDIX hydrolase [Lentisphaera araneosa HTCC2155]